MCNFKNSRDIFFKSLSDEIAMTNSLPVSIARFHSDLNCDAMNLNCDAMNRVSRYWKVKKIMRIFDNFIPGKDIWKEGVNCGLCGTINITT